MKGMILTVIGENHWKSGTMDVRGPRRSWGYMIIYFQNKNRGQWWKMRIECHGGAKGEDQSIFCFLGSYQIDFLSRIKCKLHPHNLSVLIRETI